MKLFRIFLPSVLAITLGACQPAAENGSDVKQNDYSWQPGRPVQIVVPWAAGGSTDQVIRIVAKEMEEALGTNFVVINTPGASGSIGTRGVLNARADGLTWTSGASSSLGTFPLLGLLDTNLDDWHLFLAVANVCVISVPTTSPYEDFEDLLAAMKENPGKIQVATSGVASSGHHAIEMLSKMVDTEYRHVAYAGGNPAVIATVGGETDATTQLASEQVEMIRGKRLRPLAVLSSDPLEIEGYGTIPPVTDWLPNAQFTPSYFGIWVRKDVPSDVIETMETIWQEQIRNSEPLQRYARTQGAIFSPIYGEEARAETMEKIKEEAWILYEAGQTKMSPEELNIPKPGTQL